MDTGSLDRISPTVTREKWASHARSKLTSGYVLIIGKERKNANFFKPSRGYEVCPYKIARRLVDEGIVEATDRPHYLGTVYVLSERVPIDQLKATPPPVVDDDDDDDDTASATAEMGDLLVEIEDEDDVAAEDSTEADVEENEDEAF